jgi:hypothetical protein
VWRLHKVAASSSAAKDGMRRMLAFVVGAGLLMLALLAINVRRAEEGQGAGRSFASHTRAADC